MKNDIVQHMPHLDNADEIRIEGINTPNGIRNINARVNGGGGIVKNSIVIF